MVQWRGLCVCLVHQWALQKRLNRLRCHFTANSRGPKEPCIRWESHWRQLQNTMEWSVRRPVTTIIAGTCCASTRGMFGLCLSLCICLCTCMHTQAEAFSDRLAVDFWFKITIISFCEVFITCVWWVVDVWRLLIIRCSQHHSRHQLMGGDDINQTVHAVFAALLWHTQVLWEDVERYGKLTFHC